MMPERAKAIAEAICRIAEGDLEDDTGAVRAAYPGFATEILATYRLAVPREDAFCHGSWVPPKTGELLDGYRIHGILGEGGNAVILRAEKDGRRVALKVLPPSRNDARLRLARFRREVKVLEKLDHPDIIKVEQLKIFEGMPYGVMDFIEGCSLDQLLFALRSGYRPEIQDGRLVGYGQEKPELPQPPVEQSRDYICAVIRLGIALARTLEYAHEQGVVHRDIKPGNVMIRTDGQPALLDFGLAWEFSSPRLTQTGDLVGTPAYMSPEQASADNTNVGNLTDLYALTAVLYECLTLTIPFQAEHWWEIVRKVLAETPPPPRELNPELPAALEALLLRGMAKSSEQRFHSAAEMARALEALYVRLREGSLFESSGVVDVLPEPRALPVPQRSSKIIVVPSQLGTRRRNRWWVLVVPLLLAVALVAAAFLFPGPPPDRASAFARLRADIAFPASVLEGLPDSEKGELAAYLALLLEAPTIPRLEGPTASAVYASVHEGRDVDACVASLPMDGLNDRVRLLLFQRAGQDSLALACWQRAVADGGRSPDLLALGAELQPSRARVLLEDALLKAPDGFLVHWKLGALMVKTGEVARGLELLELARRRVDAPPASLQRAVARGLLRSERVREGLELLSGLVQEADGELFLLRGEAFLRLGELASARGELRSAALSEAQRNRAWLGMAAIQLEEGQVRDARNIFERVERPSDAYWLEVYERLERRLP